MSIDDTVFRDPRITMLAQISGMSRPEALGRLIAVWALCYDRPDAEGEFPEALINLSAYPEAHASVLPDFAKQLIEADLCERIDACTLRIRGAKQRTAYLDAKAEAGRIGGRKSGESRRSKHEAQSKQRKSKHEAPPNPPDAVPDAVPDRVTAPDRVVVEATAPDRVLPEQAIPAKKAKAPRAARGTALADGWIPARSEANLEAEAKSRARGVDLRQELLKLRDWAKAGGQTAKDWEARWRNWTRNAKPLPGTYKEPHVLRMEAQLDRVAMLEAQEAAAAAQGEQVPS